MKPEEAVGFVYVIIDKSTNRKYIGKKQFSGRGKKNSGVQSDWKVYCSSSKYLKELIKEKGEDSFEFVILEQYYTVAGLHWAEVWTQVFCEIPSKNEEFMNRYIDKVRFKSSESITSKHKKIIKKVLRDYKYKNG